MLMSALMRLVDALNRDDSRARSLNVALAIFAGMIAHGLGLWIGRSMESGFMPWFALPAWIEALIWLILLALLGAARWMLNSYTIIGVSAARTMVTLLLLCCLLWPFYSLPVVDLHITLFGNIATLLLAFAAIVIVRTRSVESASLIMPLVVWLAFSTLVVLVAIGWL